MRDDLRMGIGELLGFLGGMTGMLVALPQVRRIRNLGHGRGVSLPTWVLTLTVTAAWLGWGLRVGSPSAIASNLIATVLNGAVLAALRQRGRRGLLELVGLAIAVTGAALLLPMPVLSVLLIGLTVSRLPQVRHSWTHRHSAHESAVSMGSLALSVFSLLCWEAYAVLEERHLVNVTSTISLSLILAIAWIESTAPRAATQPA